MIRCESACRAAPPGPLFGRFRTTADKGGFWPGMACPLMTPSGHQRAKFAVMHNTRSGRCDRIDVIEYHLLPDRTRRTTNNAGRELSENFRQSDDNGCKRCARSEERRVEV